MPNLWKPLEDEFKKLEISLVYQNIFNETVGRIAAAAGHIEEERNFLEKFPWLVFVANKALNTRCWSCSH